MKTAISVPDEVFAQAELAAKQLSLSRSELYSRALSEYLARHTDSEVTAAINAVMSEVGQPREAVVSAHGTRPPGFRRILSQTSLRSRRSTGVS